MRTKAQRRYIQKGYQREMIPLQGPRVSYLIGRQEDWRSQREFARDILKMPNRPICKQFIHKGRKP